MLDTRIKTVSYRPVEPSDLHSIVAIETAVHAYPWRENHFKDSIKANNDITLMMLGETMIGYAVVMTVLDEAHLLNISIAKAHQQQGFGRQLLDHVVYMSQQKQCVNLFLEVRASNQAAIHLYESIGFNEMSIRRNYYPANTGREDAILMGLAI